MSSENDSLNDDLGLSLEMLDRWETELDEFAAQVRQRLKGISDSAGGTEGRATPTEAELAEYPDLILAGDDPDAIRLLKSLRDMTQ
jgi:hypothetical protein